MVNKLLKILNHTVLNNTIFYLTNETLNSFERSEQTQSMIMNIHLTEKHNYIFLNILYIRFINYFIQLPQLRSTSRFNYDYLTTLRMSSHPSLSGNTRENMRELSSGVKISSPMISTGRGEVYWREESCWTREWWELRLSTQLSDVSLRVKAIFKQTSNSLGWQTPLGQMMQRRREGEGTVRHLVFGWTPWNYPLVPKCL